MTDINIQHCTLRVVRHGGWNWGAEPQAIVDAAVHALPELLAKKLALMLPDDAECEITTPLRINVAVRMSELVAAGAEMRSGSAYNIASSHHILSQRFENALKATLERARILTIEETGTDHQSAEEEMAEVFEPPAHSGRASALLRLLFAWREQGVLEARLSSFNQVSLEAWRQHLLKAAGHTPLRAPEISVDEIDRMVRELAHEIPHSALDRADILRCRLMIAVEVAAQLKLSPGEPSIEAAIDGLLPMGDASAVAASYSTSTHDDGVRPELAASQSAIATGTAASRIGALSTGRSAPTRSRSLLDADMHVSSALPFLLLGPLARLGYLETLAATLEAAEIEKHSSLFAAALAYKVLDPPERGWRRNSDNIAAAAAFAGVDAPPAESSLVEFSDKIRAHLAPLDAVLSGALIEGHRHGQPLFLQRMESAQGSGFLLVDVEGLFPVAWTIDAASLFKILRKFGTVALLIPESAAEPALLRELDAQGFSFITDATPTRTERWRELRRPPAGRWWTNDHTTQRAALERSAQHLSRTEEAANELWRELDAERPSVPLSSDASLDRHLTVAASVALGTIAWTLWGERELSAPQLALARFRSMDARVCFNRQSVRVRLPLGRRYQDLLQHGWLKSVRMVPWMGGRVLSFAGG